MLMDEIENKIQLKRIKKNQKNNDCIWYKK
jgi:hypothetical protein